ncbi:hypothetical protein JCM10212_005913 [Sporobolomyces blumeae]
MTSLARPSQPFSTSSPAYSEPIIPRSGLAWSLAQRLSRGIAFVVVAIIGLVALHTVDLALYVSNLVTPQKRAGKVVPAGFSPARPPSVLSHPIAFVLCKVANALGEKNCPDFLWQWTNWRGIGHQGDWGHFGLDAGASRSPCPALNALANAGVLPRDGRDITQAQLSSAISRAYNLAPTLAIQLTLPFSPLFEARGRIDLEDISAPGLVQHDGSTTREDINSPYAEATVAATQGTPSPRLLELYWPEDAVGYTWQNSAAILAHARRTSRSVNGQFYLTPSQYIFSSGNMALQQTVIGGKIADLRAWLGASPPGVEGFRKGFEPKARQAWGVSILQAQLYTALIELTCGPLHDKARELAKGNDVSARNGWNAMEGEVGEKNCTEKMHTVDLALYVSNLVTPQKRAGKVVPAGFSPARPPSVLSHPIVFVLCKTVLTSSATVLWQWTNWRGIGHQGDWGHIGLDAGASRSPCPALNALANAGVLPRDGRDITQAQLSSAISRAYNLAPTLAIQLTLPFSPLFEARGRIDLEDISAPGLVQHDGSTTREDINSPYAEATVAATQGTPSPRLLELYWPEDAVEYTWQNSAAILAQ